MLPKIGMKGHRQDYVGIIFGVVLTIIVVAIALIITSTPQTENAPDITRSLVPTAIPPTPTNIPSNTEKKYITYDNQASNRLLDRVNNRAVLTINDKLAKAKILALFPPGVTSGVLYQTDTIIIDYTPAIDLFMVEILTPDVAQAKAEANVWFRTKGMSQKGLCNLPLMFYMNTGVVQNMQNLDIKFSPVAPSC